MNFKDILNTYKYTTELHAHCFPSSPCGDFSAEEVVNFYKESGVTSLVLTNHLTPELTEGDAKECAERYLADYKAAKKAAGNDINIILGVEIRFEETKNDYLIYGVCEEDLESIIVSVREGLEHFYKKVKSDKAIIIQAHPFRKNMTLAPIEFIDGIESINMHPNHHAKPSIAFKYAKENNLIVSGGSDFHHQGHHALCLMRTEKEMKDSYDVAEALKNKEAIFDCSGHIIVPYIY